MTGLPCSQDCCPDGHLYPSPGLPQGTAAHQGPPSKPQAHEASDRQSHGTHGPSPIPTILWPDRTRDGFRRRALHQLGWLGFTVV